MEFTVRSYCETQYNSVVRAPTLASFLSLQSNTLGHTHVHTLRHICSALSSTCPQFGLSEMLQNCFFFFFPLESMAPLLRNPYQPCHFSELPAPHPSPTLPFLFVPRCQSEDAWLWSCIVSPSASVLVSSLFLFFQLGSRLKYGTVTESCLCLYHSRIYNTIVHVKGLSQYCIIFAALICRLHNDNLHF